MQKPVQSQKIYSRQRLLQFILLTLSRFLHIVYLQYMNELPNSDKTEKIFKQIILVSSKAEKKKSKTLFTLLW